MQFDESVGGVTLRMEVRGSLASVWLEGVLTPDALRAVKSRVIALLQEAGAVVGFLVDYVEADVRCSADELDALFDGDQLHDQSVVPAAMVVTTEQLPLFKAHVWDVAWRGIVRQAFTDVADAATWLKDRAAAAAQAREGLRPAK